MEFSTTKITPNDNVKIPSINGDNAGYMETDELKEYMNDSLITQSITDGDTDHAPSSDAVNGALNAITTTVAKKLNGSTDYNRIEISGSDDGAIFYIRAYLTSDSSKYVQFICNNGNKTFSLVVNLSGTETTLFSVTGT